MAVNQSGLSWASVTWDGNHPCSSEYDDVYYSRANGYQEREQVFFVGNNLEARWKAGGAYAVGELGFGTGLSFLITWSHWARLRPHGTSLLFQSCDRSPLSPSDLSRACAAWPALEPWSSQLLARYPELAPGWHQLDFPLDRLTLRLYFGDARAALPGYQPTDAWFLDGFSPKKNTDLWTSEIAALVRAQSSPGATVSTYSAASAVFRAYRAQGFEMQHVPGFGGKRERLQGTLRTDYASGLE